MLEKAARRSARRGDSGERGESDESGERGEKFSSRLKCYYVVYVRESKAAWRSARLKIHSVIPRLVE
jgi:hypothetical protein